MVSSSVAGREAGTRLRNAYSPHGCSSLREGDEHNETLRRLLVMVKCMVERAEMVVAGQKKRQRPARECASNTRRGLRTLAWRSYKLLLPTLRRQTLVDGMLAVMVLRW
jgi:hypothetical protein